jgi:hypothetical protein
MIRRFLFLLFAVLDAVLVIRFAPADFEQLGGLSQMSLPAASLFVLRLIFFVSLAASAVGLCLAQKWALIISYIQFPFRFIFMLLSFGFISGFAHLFAMPGLYRPMIYAAMILECGRLIGSVWIHRTPNTALEPTVGPTSAETSSQFRACGDSGRGSALGR